MCSFNQLALYFRINFLEHLNTNSAVTKPFVNLVLNGRPGSNILSLEF